MGWRWRRLQLVGADRRPHDDRPSLCGGPGGPARKWCRVRGRGPLSVDDAQVAHTFNTTGWPTLYIDGTGATVSDVVVGDLTDLTALWSGDTEDHRRTDDGATDRRRCPRRPPGTYTRNRPPTTAHRRRADVGGTVPPNRRRRVGPAPPGRHPHLPVPHLGLDRPLATTSQGTFGDDPPKCPTLRSRWNRQTRCKSSTRSPCRYLTAPPARHGT